MIAAPVDLQIGSAGKSSCNANDQLTGTGLGNWYLLDPDISHGHRGLPPPSALRKYEGCSGSVITAARDTDLCSRAPVFWCSIMIFMELA